MGADSFSYKIRVGGVDGNNVSASITVTNDAPQASADSYRVQHDQTLTVSAAGVLGNDSDSNANDTLTAAPSAARCTGSVTLNADGSFTYTPSAGYKVRTVSPTRRATARPPAARGDRIDRRLEKLRPFRILTVIARLTTTLRQHRARRTAYSLMTKKIPARRSRPFWSRDRSTARSRSIAMVRSPTRPPPATLASILSPTKPATALIKETPRRSCWTCGTSRRAARPISITSTTMPC